MRSLAFNQCRAFFPLDGLDSCGVPENLNHPVQNYDCLALNGRFAETSAERTDGEVERGFGKPAIEGTPSG